MGDKLWTDGGLGRTEGRHIRAKKKRFFWLINGRLNRGKIEDKYRMKRGQKKILSRNYVLSFIQHPSCLMTNQLFFIRKNFKSSGGDGETNLG